MKRRDLIKRLENSGWYLIRHGGNHDIYSNGLKNETIPRHDEMLARRIIKRIGI